jgi:hypothetical protein
MNFLSFLHFLEFQLIGNTLIPSLTLATSTDRWATGHVTCHVGVDRSMVDWELTLPPARHWTVTTVLWSSQRRTDGPTRTRMRWWTYRLLRPHLMVTRASSTMMNCGGARWSNARTRYGWRKSAIRGPGDAEAHLDASWTSYDNDWGQKWVHNQEFCDSLEKGNG